ncbi:MAG: hypothetical protein A3F73_13785 [Gallionellales bacterium RIFCSPLOWO2_12_FULL_59_22]|nr:MAG: hypothetical protein A3H99_06250 [Gallionellales bacterium RIFCSPLOWO2_02_FULL_59_110]OGT02012.1 MAG: hypothetical protein A2Z65_02110 [Gallionellales bacterium RIFCSPLOWO2_02_58_13]OGT10386.1 MAG: hypothetical protein A3F73_13785 [Gallionellales bacterium RIFCSPLOWO2_12_FULL_59_22]
MPLVSGATVITPPAQAGLDQGTALATLMAPTQACISLGAAIALNTVNLGAGPGVFPPGCYSTTGAMDIALSTTVTLSGAGVYIFKSAGAITTGANSRVVLAGGACGSDVFWTGVGATTLGAYTGALPAPTTFVGTIIDDAGITLGEFANLAGRALAFGGTVTTDKNTITVPTCAPFVPPATPAGQTASSKAFFPTTIAAGGVSRLTITLSNNNAGVATLDAGGFTDTLPAGLVIAPTPNAVTSCGGIAPAGVVTTGANSVSLSAGTTIPGGAPGMCTVAVDVTAAAAGSYTNTLPVLFTDQVESAAPAGVTLSVLAVSASGIPTLSEWAMILLASLLAMLGFAAMRKQAR